MSRTIMKSAWSSGASDLLYDLIHHEGCARKRVILLRQERRGGKRIELDATREENEEHGQTMEVRRVHVGVP